MTRKTIPALSGEEIEVPQEGDKYTDDNGIEWKWTARKVDDTCIIYEWTQTHRPSWAQEKWY